MKRHN